MYNAIEGPRGLITYSNLRGEVREAETMLADVQSERQRLESEVDRLRRESLDPDLLEERARRTLNYAHPDELIILKSPTSGDSRTPN